MSNRVLVVVSVLFIAVIAAAAGGRIAWIKYQHHVANDPETHFMLARDAIYANDPTRFSALIAQYPHLISTRTRTDGTTLLHSAMINGGNLGCASILITKGADVNATDHQGGTPLHALCTYKDVGFDSAIVELLATSGADMNAADSSGVRPLDMLVSDTDMYTEVFPDYISTVNSRNRDLLKSHGAVK